MATQLVAETNSVQPFTFQSLGELFSAPPESVPYIVDGLLPSAGVSVLAGKPKAGKSTLVRQLAVAVAKGQTFLGRSTEQGAVLLFAIEDKSSEVGKHLLQLGATPDDPIGVLCGAIKKHEAISRLEAAITAKPGVRLVVIDPMMRFACIRDSDDYVEVNDWMEKLLAIARRYNIHIITSHHLKKRATEDPADGALGSIAISGGADTLICLKSNAAGVRTICTRQRYGNELPETELVWDPDLRKPSLGNTTDEIRDQALQRTRQQIDAAMLNFVEQTPGCTQQEIFAAVTGNTALVKQAFREFVEAGVFVQSGTGVKGDPYRYRPVTQVG